MAAQGRYLFIILMSFNFCHSKAAILPHNLLSAHGKLTQGMMSHGLDLADLSLPPEVITEALFSQTDLLQDKLEQCEEKVRSNLKGDDGAETEGLEAEAEDQIDDEDEDDDNDGGDSFDKKVAQLAVDAFEHHGDEDYDDVHGQEASEEDKAGGKEPGRAAPGPGKEAKSSVSEQEDESDDEEKEYIVYEYEDVVEDEEAHEKEKAEGGQRSEESSAQKEDKNNVSKEQINNDKDKKKAGKDAANINDHGNNENDLSNPQNGSKKENNKESNKHVEETRRTSPPVTSQSKGSEAETDSVDSDEEEPQSTPEEVTITLENHSSESTAGITGHDNSVAPDHTSVENTRTPSPPPPPTPPPTTTTTTRQTTTSQGMTTSKPKEGKPPAPQQKAEQPISDSHNEGRRHKRSLSSNNIVMAEKVDDNLLREVHGVSFGKGRIRRQASPRQDTKPQVLEYSQSRDEAGEEGTEPIESLNEMLTPLLVELGEEHRENQREGDLQDMLKMAEDSWLPDLASVGGEAPTRDLLQLAEDFLQKHTPLQPEATWQDSAEVEHLMAASRLPRGADRVRRRRSLLGRGLSPERYVPLIDQLVERLNYLQHSVQVCHMLLPPQHLHDQHLHDQHLHAANNTAA